MCLKDEQIRTVKFIPLQINQHAFLMCVCVCVCVSVSVCLSVCECVKMILKVLKLKCCMKRFQGRCLSQSGESQSSGLLPNILDPQNIRLPVKVERATQGLLCPVILTSGIPSHWDPSRDKGGRQMLAIHGSFSVYRQDCCSRDRRR